MIDAHTLRLVPAADGGPGIRADRGRKLLQAEPGAGLIRAHLKRDAFAEHVDGQLEIFERRRTKRKRLLRLQGARRIREARE